MSAIASEDFDAALRELPRIPEDERIEAEAALHGKTMLDRCTGDIGSVMQALEQLPERLRSKAGATIFHGLTLRYQTQVEQWISSNPTSPGVQALQIALADRDAFLSNARREALLAGSLSTINENAGVSAIADSYIQYLAKTDPPSAAAWFARVPEGDPKYGIAQTLAQRWATTDTAAAVVWAEQLPPSEGRDGALLALAEKQRVDLDEAVRRVSQIAHPQRRFGSAQALVERWALADPERAMMVVTDVSLSEEQRLILQAIVASSPTRIRNSKAAP